MLSICPRSSVMDVWNPAEHPGDLNCRAPSAMRARVRSSSTTTGRQIMAARS